MCCALQFVVVSPWPAILQPNSRAAQQLPHHMCCVGELCWSTSKLLLLSNVWARALMWLFAACCCCCCLPCSMASTPTAQRRRCQDASTLRQVGAALALPPGSLLCFKHFFPQGCVLCSKTQHNVLLDRGSTCIPASRVHQQKLHDMQYRLNHTSFPCCRCSPAPMRRRCTRCNLCKQHISILPPGKLHRSDLQVLPETRRHNMQGLCRKLRRAGSLLGPEP